MAIYFVESGKGTRSLENRQLKDSLRLELETWRRRGMCTGWIQSPVCCCVRLRFRSFQRRERSLCVAFFFFCTFDFVRQERDGLQQCSPLELVPFWFRSIWRWRVFSPTVQESVRMNASSQGKDLELLVFRVEEPLQSVRVWEVRSEV